MAGQTVTISVLADTKKFSRAFKGLSKETGLTRLGNTVKKMGKAVAVGAAAAAAGAVVIGKKLIEAGERAGTSNARIANIVKTMGLFEGQTDKVAGRVVNLSDKIARATGIDQNSIKVTAAKLLTFKELAKSADEVGGHFDRATKAAIDLAAAGFGNAETNAAQLGRALNDPIKGINALTRTGVVFTDAEKERIKAMVEAGDIASAQAVVLDALETQVGGTAEATANATDRMKVAWSQVQERLGQKLMPILDKVSAWFIDVALPAVEGFARNVATHLQPKLEALGTWFRREGLPRLQAFGKFIRAEILPRLASLARWVTGRLIPGLRRFGEWIAKNQDWLKALAIVVGTIVIGIQAYVKVMAIWRAAVIVATAAQAAFNAVMAANPIGLIVLAIAALVAGLTYFFTQTETGKKVWKSFTDFLGKAWDKIKEWAGKLWEFLKKVFSWTPVGMIVKNWNKITAFFGRTKDKIVKFFRDAWDFIKRAWSYTPLGLIVTNWDKILGFFRGIPEKVKGVFSNAIGWLKSAGRAVMTGMREGIIDRWNRLREWFTGIKDRFLGVVRNAGDWLKSAGRAIMEGLWNGLKQKWEDVKGWFSGIGDWIKQNKGPRDYDLRLLRPAGRWILQGLQAGLREELPRLRRTLGTVTTTVAQTPFEANATVNPRKTGGNTYNITVSGVLDGADAGRKIVAAIREYERMNGYAR